MVPTFILTRAFAISALFVGALPSTYAAPVPSVRMLEGRQCRRMGCLIALPNSSASQTASAAASSSTAEADPPMISTITMSSETVLSILDALTDASNALKTGLTDAGVAITANSNEVSFASLLAASLDSKSSEATDVNSSSAVDITIPPPAVEAGPLTKISRPVDGADSVDNADALE